MGSDFLHFDQGLLRVIGRLKALACIALDFGKVVLVYAWVGGVGVCYPPVPAVVGGARSE